jgi:hypothetical protein
MKSCSGQIKQISTEKKTIRSSMIKQNKITKEDSISVPTKHVSWVIEVCTRKDAVTIYSVHNYSDLGLDYH